MSASLLTVFEWWGATPLGIWMHHSRWAFAAIETLHLLGIAALGGAVIVVELRALDLLKVRAAPHLFARQLAPWLFGNLLLLSTGLLLVAAAPLKYYYNAAFAAKLIFLLLATLSYPLLHRPGLDQAGRRARYGGALLSLLLWASIGVAGRAIGLL
ncbi:MAG: hypothetical protein QM718_05800 [Steroidobacteraceae bacterium]